MADISNIFLFNDISKVRRGVNAPTFFDPIPTTDDQNIDNIISINDAVYTFRYPYGWDIPNFTVFTQGNLEYTWSTPGLRFNGYQDDHFKIKVSSNLIIVDELPFSPAFISFPDGDIEKNGVSIGTTTTVINGDTIRISVSNFPALVDQPKIYEVDISGIIVQWSVELSDPEVSGFGVEVVRPSTAAGIELSHEAQTTISNAAESMSRNKRKN